MGGQPNNRTMIQALRVGITLGAFVGIIVAVVAFLLVLMPIASIFSFASVPFVVLTGLFLQRRALSFLDAQEQKRAILLTEAEREQGDAASRAALYTPRTQNVGD